MKLFKSLSWSNTVIIAVLGILFFRTDAVALGGYGGWGMGPGMMMGGWGAGWLMIAFWVLVLIGLIFSVLIYITVVFWQGPLFAAILSLSMFVVIIGAAILGALVPLVFKRFNIDPALATAPFIATTNDIFGLLVYLSIMTTLLGLFS